MYGYAREYSGQGAHGYRSHSFYNRGYRGLYNSDAIGYKEVDKIHHLVIDNQYGYRFIPLQPQQKTNIQQNSFTRSKISEAATGSISPSYSLEIDFNEPRAHVQLKTEPEELVFNSLSEPTTNTQGYIQENLLSSQPLSIFKFPSRLPIEDSTPSPVQPSSLTVKTSPPNPLPSALPPPVPAVPGHPVLGDYREPEDGTEQIQSIFIPMPVPAVPKKSNKI